MFTGKIPFKWVIRVKTRGDGGYAKFYCVCKGVALQKRNG